MDSNASIHSKGSPPVELAARDSSSSDGTDEHSANNHTLRYTPASPGPMSPADMVVLARVQSAKSAAAATVGSPLDRARSRDSRRLTPTASMGLGRQMPAFSGGDEFVVEFDGDDDPRHPQNWPWRTKLITASVLGFTTFICVFASSIFSPAIPYVAAEFGVGREVAVLGMSLYVLGFAFGPIFWAPLSELRGRVLPIRLGIFGFTLFQFAVATGKDLQTILICRFFGGLFASSPLAVVAAVFSDMFDNRTRGLALTSFSLAVFTSPLMAPFIGGFIGMSHLGWRWMEYLVGIIGAAATVLCLVFFQETYAPAILVSKAAEIRRQTGNWAIHARQEEVAVDFRQLIEKNFSRPLVMLFKEPIVLLISIYIAFIYGLLYLFMTAYPIVFQGVHHMNPGVGGLPFFGMIGGQVIAGVMMIIRQPAYQRKLAANNNVPIPEWRLPEVIAGGAAFAVGLFWFAWTGHTASIHWIVPTLSGLLTGFGLMAIFLQAINYLVDAYLIFAASALAANTFLRSICGAAFPLFASQMFNGMGVQWAGTLLGCIAVVLVPVPVIFWKWGHVIRKRSKLAYDYPTPEKLAATKLASEKQTV